MSSNRRRLLKSHDRSTVRRLRFDLLEERRLLAGLDVYLFNDVTGSRSTDAPDSTPFENKAVYVDLNRNGSFDPSEPWALSDRQGRASFSNLNPGDYVIRLLGNNSRVHQSYPTEAASDGIWSDGFEKVLASQSDGTSWAIRFDQLVHLGKDLSSTLRTVSFGNRIVLDAAILESGTETRGFALTRLPDGLVQLWHFVNRPDVAPVVVPVDATDYASITSNGSGIWIRTHSGGLIELQNPVQPVLTTVVPNHSGVQHVKSLGPNSLVVEQSDGDTSTFSILQRIGGNVQTLSSRTFDHFVSAWDVSPSKGVVAVSTDNGMIVLDAQNGLLTKESLHGATAPIIFDSARDVLITGDLTTDNQLRFWDSNAWRSKFTLPILNDPGVSLREGQFQLDEFGRYLIGQVNGHGYRHDLASPSAILATVSEIETASIAIGIRVSGQNKPPEISANKSIGLNEDQAVSLNFATGLTASGLATPMVVGQDLDGDSLVYVIRNNPLLGSLSWNQPGAAQYVPTANANGTDHLIVQAYDGIDWSPSQSIQLNIAAINDLPSEIVASISVLKENSPAGTVIGNIRVDDPDSDSNYDYIVNDSRISIVGGIIRLVSANVSYEKEHVLTIPVTAYDRVQLSDVINRTLTIQVSDENDPPTAIVLPSGSSVPELNAGAIVGPIQVLDEDSDASYEFSVSDHRFEVSNGVLKLREGVQLDYESESQIRLTVTATETDGQGTLTSILTLHVTDQGETPFDLYFNCIEEVQAGSAGVVVGYAEVIDFSNVEYFFSVNDARFEIRNGVVSLKPATSLSYSTPGYIDLTVTAVSELGEAASKTSRLYIVPDPTPHHNDDNPYDVDGDGHVTPLDPLIIINYINANGTGPMRDPGEGEGQVPDIDVDGDGQITPIDILILINQINGASQNQNSSGPSKNPIDNPDNTDSTSEGATSGSDNAVIDVGFTDDEWLSRRRTFSPTAIPRMLSHVLPLTRLTKLHIDRQPDGV